ncbi:ABC transporter ATP-binding protein [Campylobacter helveticus]|uniref:ABC transporter ATP-binding protein n=1 Tax=Campylobacter helveticus TaxID=28898 RepID=UPI0022EAD08F|nr:metal ABC transporter ATP-binding protein [Campylobacter helveticus]
MLYFKINNLNYSYDKEEILKNINLSYDSREFLSIIGANGAGKSTLLKLILGLLNSKKQIEFFNIQKNEIAYVPQQSLINTNFNARVLEIVLMGLVGQKIFGFYTKEDQKKALKTLKSIGMEEFWNKSFNELSGGQRQKVLIARALVYQCKLLILDEPTASVDSKSAVQIFEMLSALHSEGMGVITVCHDINLVLAYSDKIAHLNKELFLHNNDKKEKQKSTFLKHLYENHTHFCDVEMSLEHCLDCEEKNFCESKIINCPKNPTLSTIKNFRQNNA